MEVPYNAHNTYSQEGIQNCVQCVSTEFCNPMNVFKFKRFVETFPAFCSGEIVSFTVVFSLVLWSDLKIAISY